MSDGPAVPRREYPDRPIVGVGAVVLVDGRIVLIKRGTEPRAGEWSLPGGVVEVGETLVQGVAREVLEETGCVVDVGPVIEVFDRITYDDARKVQYHFVLIDYLCRSVGGRLQAGSDVLEAVLADPGRLDGFALTPKVLEVIQRGMELSWKRE